MSRPPMLTVYIKLKSYNQFDEHFDEEWLMQYIYIHSKPAAFTL
jgi:hypothetical protein